MLTAGRRRRDGAHGICGVVAGLLLAGCGGSLTPADAPPQSSPVPATDAMAEARRLLENAGLALPPSAAEVRVEAVADDVFSKVTVTRFSAPRTDAAAMCTDGDHLYGETTVVPTYEAELLGIATEPVQGGTPLPDGTESCRFSLDARRQVLVLVGPGDPAHTDVMLYRFPSR